MKTSSIVGRLILKDWQFHRKPMIAYTVVGVLSLILLAVGSQLQFYVGSVLYISALIAGGVHLIMASVVQERSRKNLAFVMSLPVSAMDYTRAKIYANVLIFLVPWTALTVLGLVTVLARGTLPNGLIPFLIVVTLEILVGYCLTLAVAVVSESEGWTIAAVVVANLGFQFFLYFVSHLPSVEATLEGPRVVFGSELVTILAVELLAIPLILVSIFFFQARKRDFL